MTPRKKGRPPSLAVRVRQVLCTAKKINLWCQCFGLSRRNIHVSGPLNDVPSHAEGESKVNGAVTLQVEVAIWFRGARSAQVVPASFALRETPGVLAFTRPLFSTSRTQTTIPSANSSATTQIEVAVKHAPSKPDKTTLRMC